MGKHFGFTGTQNQLTPSQVNTLFSVLKGLLADEYEWMHNGDCIGADLIAANHWRFIGGKIFLHPPGINTKRACFFNPEAAIDPKPYRERNQDIVDASELLVACPKGMEEELRSGTWMTVRMALRKGIRVIGVFPDGSVTEDYSRG